MARARLQERILSTSSSLLHDERGRVWVPLTPESLVTAFQPIPTVQGEQPLDQVLRGIHYAWVQEARTFLEPATAAAADFWTRWAAIRYLDDEFRDRYDLERGLLAALRPFLPPATAERIAHEGERVFRLRLELDRVGRRHGTAPEVADGARALLDQLVLWLTTIEQAVAGLTRDTLAPEGEILLAHMEATGETNA